MISVTTWSYGVDAWLACREEYVSVGAGPTPDARDDDIGAEGSRERP